MILVVQEVSTWERLFFSVCSYCHCITSLEESSEGLKEWITGISTVLTLFDLCLFLPGKIVKVFEIKFITGMLPYHGCTTLSYLQQVLYVTGYAHSYSVIALLFPMLNEHRLKSLVYGHLFPVVLNHYRLKLQIRIFAAYCPSTLTVLTN